MEKTARKNTKYSRNERILKIGHLAKPIADAKGMGFAEWLVWVKNWKSLKNGKSHSTRTFTLLYAENRSKKHQIFEKWDNFETRPSCKAYSLCKGHSFLKMVSWVRNQKCQKHAKNHSTRGLEMLRGKRPFENTPSTPEMRQFWKSNIFTFLGLYLTQDPWDLVGLSTSDRCIEVCTLDEFC